MDFEVDLDREPALARELAESSERTQALPDAPVFCAPRRGLRAHPNGLAISRLRDEASTAEQAAARDGQRRPQRVLSVRLRREVQEVLRGFSGGASVRATRPL